MTTLFLIKQTISCVSWSRYSLRLQAKRWSLPGLRYLAVVRDA